MSSSKMKFEGKGTPLGDRRRRRRKRSDPSADSSEISTGAPCATPSPPESMRARAGADAGRKRASDGRKRKEEKRSKKARGRRPGEEKAPRKRPKAPQKKPNSKDVEKWFREGIWSLFGRKFIVPAWPASCGQRALSLKLLENYGTDLTKRAVMLFCQTWDQRVRESGGRLSGAPTVNLLWAMRERVFAEVQTQDRKPEADTRPGGRDSDEFREDDSGPGLGWG